MSDYSPSAIVQAADTKVKAGDIAGAEMIYKDALLNWEDDAREGSNDIVKMANTMADLWCAYADFFRNLKKYKSCLDAYEDATQCPISGSSGKIWRNYANYCHSRNRPRHAQKVYVRALTGDEDNNRGAVSNETERFKLWNDFLQLTKETANNPELTIDQLMAAVQAEHNSNSNKDININEDNIRPPKIQKTHDFANESSSATNSNANSSLPSTEHDANSTSAYTIPKHSPAIIASNIQVEAAQLFSNTKGNIAPELMATWLATDGDSPPTRPEPPLFNPSPPKLSDGSGKHILGSELALQLVRTLLNKEQGNVILDVCKGCWVMTSLKEQEAVKVIQKFEKQMKSELKLLESKLTARQSVAGPALTAVQQINENERNEFMIALNQKHQQLLDNIAWEFRKLLALQQNILTAANLHGFHGATVDAQTIALQSKICSVMHSAFFLRTRVGEQAHVTMLSNLEDKLSKEKVTPPPPPPRRSEKLVIPPINYAPQQQRQHPHNLPPPPPFNLPVPNFPPYTGQQPLFHVHLPVGIPPPHGLHPRVLPAMQHQQGDPLRPLQQPKSKRRGGKQRSHQNHYRQSQKQIHFR